MKQSEKTRNLLIKHYQKYPRLQTQDILKFLYQSAFGCEHLVSSLEMAINGIRKEYGNLTHGVAECIDELDGEYSRVHLSCLNGGLDAETLGKLFTASAKFLEFLNSSISPFCLYASCPVITNISGLCFINKLVI